MATFLAPDNILNIQVGKKVLSIKQKIIPNSLRATKYVASYVKVGDPMKPCTLLNNGTGNPKGITVHNTDNIITPSGTNPAEQYCRATYNGNMNGAVVHFYVYKNEIWQLLNENEQGWHASDGSTRRIDHRGVFTGGNADTIAIECIGNFEESEDTTAYLVAYLCYKYSLDPMLDVYTHNYWMHGTDITVPNARKNCPIFILDHWDSFLKTINKYYTTHKNSIGDDDVAIVFNTVDDIPAGEFRDTIVKLMNTPSIHGTGNIINGYGDGTIRLTEDMVRMFVINNRAGLYDNLK